MKTIGLVGGLTWHSTIDYYRYFNQLANTRLGDDHTVRILLYSVNYGEIKKLTLAGEWDKIADIMSEAARRTETAGADCLLLGANTMHEVADRVQSVIRIPLLHIADAVGEAIREKQIRTIALLGTRFTMQFDFYKQKLAAHGIDTLVPGREEMEWVNDSIYRELGKGIMRDETRQEYIRLIGDLGKKGAAGVILGCTEIPLLIRQEHCRIPVFDSTLLHAKAAVNFALGG